jgi:hypothetical protein
MINWKQAVSGEQGSIDRYSGEYNFGKYAVKIYRQDGQLWANTAVGKAVLKQSGNPAEFNVMSSQQGSGEKYVFATDKQGQISHLVWSQANGQQRRCPKVQPRQPAGQP